MRVRGGDQRADPGTLLHLARGPDRAHHRLGHAVSLHAGKRVSAARAAHPRSAARAESIRGLTWPSSSSSCRTSAKAWWRAGSSSGSRRRGTRDGHKVLATPVTRRMAREMGVDLGSLQGSGPQGRVMKADVLAHAENKTAGAPVPAPPRMEALAQDEVRPLRGLRKSIAKSMAQSHAHVVAFTFVEECDTGPLTSLRERVNAELARRGEAKLSYLPFIAKALLHGFAKYPELNALMDEEKQALVVKKDANIGFGAATGQGLTVFVVKDVRGKTLREIGAEIDRLAKAAREQKLQLQDLQGSTFTITSLGRDGGLLATPVVKHPEVGILGIHKIKEWAKPVRRADGTLGAEIAQPLQ